MIKRYATPYEYFILPFTAEEISKLKVTYSQNGNVICEKDDSDITIFDVGELDNASMNEELMQELQKKSKRYSEFSVAMIHLTQEDTAKFIFHKAAEKNIALIQFHIVNTEDDSFVSRPVHVRIYGNLNEGVL